MGAGVARMLVKMLMKKNAISWLSELKNRSCNYEMPMKMLKVMIIIMSANVKKVK